MKKINLIVILLSGISITGIKAQQVVLSSGSNAFGSGGNVSYSVGQMEYNYQTGSNGSANQGVQQPYEFFSVGIDDHQNINLNMTVYPNPSGAAISLVTNEVHLDHLSYQLYDINGRLLLNREVNNTITLIPMETVAQGSYVLKVLNKKSLLKTFTLIKNQ